MIRLVTLFAVIVLIRLDLRLWGKFDVLLDTEPLDRSEFPLEHSCTRATEIIECSLKRVLAADIEELFHVPDGDDPQQFKQRLLERHAAGQIERRERFIEALSAWLAEQLGAGAPSTVDGA